MRKILLVLSLLFLLVSRTPALAHHQAILGVSTPSALPTIAPTAEGPGLILPDSPFFFLDKLKQNTRLFFAFTSEEKAKIRASIAGERLAELRFMLAKNNRAGVSTDLKEISENLRESAKEVSKAQFAGRDVKKLAREINDNIKAKQKTLDTLERQVSGSIKLETAQTQEAIFESKVEVEDALPENELENEVRDDLARKIERKVNTASESARFLRRDLDELTKKASESASKSLKRREETLKEAIEKSDATLRKVQEKLLEAEKKKQESLLKAQAKAAEQAQEALEKAQKAATGFEKAQQVVNQIRNTAVTNGGSGGTGSIETPKSVSTPKPAEKEGESGKH